MVIALPSSRQFILFFAIYQCIAVLIVVPFTGASDELLDIQSQIQRTGAKWTAGLNQISILPVSEQMKLCRVRFDNPIVSLQEDMSTLKEEDVHEILPAKFDWRNYLGANKVTSIKHQKCGDGWAFATIAALESRLLIDTNQSLDLSEQLLISNSFELNNCTGGSIGSTARFLFDIGSPEESCYPYRNGKDSIYSDACNNWQFQTYRFSKYHSIPQDIDAIKAAIYYQGPVSLSMVVYSDFSAYLSGIYSNVAGHVLGGHAVLAIGYDDHDQYFIVKNSWGKEWGESGFFKIAYDQVHSPVQFGISAYSFGEDINHDSAGFDAIVHSRWDEDSFLSNGQTISGISGNQGSWSYFIIKVPAGVENLEIQIGDGLGDADLYTKFGEQPTMWDYDNRPYRWGNHEVSRIISPTEGFYHIGIRGYHSYDGLSLTAVYNE